MKNKLLKILGGEEKYELYQCLQRALSAFDGIQTAQGEDTSELEIEVEFNVKHIAERLTNKKVIFK